MIILHNVIDRRTNQFHSEAIISPKILKWFDEVDDGSFIDENTMLEKQIIESGVKYNGYKDSKCF